MASLQQKKWFYSQPDYELNISIKCDDVKHNKVGSFIINKIYSYLLANEYNDEYFYIGEFHSNYEEKEEVGFTLVFNFDKDELNRCKRITEDFCYVTSYEDEENVYLYSVKELNKDNVFDIEEGLFNLLGLISVAKDDAEDTLEDYFSNIKDKE